MLVYIYIKYMSSGKQYYTDFTEKWFLNEILLTGLA